MKRSFLLIIVIVFAQNLSSQSIVDALRYSTDGLHGTARFSGMGGAFGALGGDMSAIQLNPASSAVFLNSTASVTLSLVDRKNETNYFNNYNRNFNSDLSFNQAGVVFVFDNFEEDAFWRKFTLGLNFDVKKNFDDGYFATGQSNNSIDSYFLGYAQGVQFDLLELQSGETISSLYRFLGENYGFGTQQAFLGYQSYIIDPVDFDNPNNTTYISNVAPGVFNQEFGFSSSGYNAKATINIGMQIKDNLFVGANLNSHIIEYRESTYFYEQNSNADSYIKEIGFRNNLAVLGDGFSAQLGFISRPTDFFRVGITYDTPTWYTITEETTQRISTVRTEENQQILETVRPNIINLYEDYTLKTPGKFTGSVAYLFGRDGLISVDYSYRDYSNIRFRPSGIAAFNAENAKMSNALKAASSIKIGGEYRVDQLSLRGGLQFEESPYNDTEMMGDLKGFSLGLGYSFGDFRLDLAYARTEQQRKHQFYTNSAFSNATSIKSTENYVALTANFGF
jgi:hypothetical protein